MEQRHVDEGARRVDENDVGREGETDYLVIGSCLLDRTRPQERVRELARKLGYSPDPQAASLRDSSAVGGLWWDRCTAIRSVPAVTAPTSFT